MSQINRPPIGLQSLLGSKNFGKNPDDLSQIVQPTVEMFPFWASQQLRFSKTQTTTAGNASVIEAQVPAGKTWAVVSACLSVEVLVPGTDDINAGIAIDENLTGNVYYFVHNETMVNAVQSFFRSIWTPPVLFWIPPEFVIRGIFDGSDLSEKIFELDLIYYELDV